MAMILQALRYLVYVLIFPGFLFCFLSGLLLCGIDRKLVARMQKRIGPPVLQPFYDFFKLCGKETIIPAAANRTVFLLAPLVGLAGLVVIQLFIPIFRFSAFKGIADVIVILYLLLIPALAVILGGAASGSPYAGVGLSREMVARSISHSMTIFAENKRPFFLFIFRHFLPAFYARVHAGN